MLLFLFGLVLLFVGYMTYGKFVEKVLAPDSRKTPAHTLRDGVDFLVLPHWKNMLIQLLNIAGVGPVIGVLMGIKFGSAAFLIIPFVNVIAGATHDFLAGMMSLRHRGANLPSLTRKTLGIGYYWFFSIFVLLLLLLVVAVFINIPAQLIDGLIPEFKIFWLAVVTIFIYYIIATMFPVDQIIGRFYPVFGALLLLGTTMIFVALLWHGNENINLLRETAEFKAGMDKSPIIPVLFVTIACGIISGFHATQSPIIARTMDSEHQARPAFYGMMIAEGVIAMIWAAAGMAMYNLRPELLQVAAPKVLSEITKHFLGSWMSVITILGVVILAITSGDTAMRSLRLSMAEMLKLDQKPLKNRFILIIPIILVVILLLTWSNSSAASFGRLWNYFAWANQVLAASTLMAATAWLAGRRLNYWIAAIPGMFMTFIVATYILWISPERGGPVGFGLPLRTAYWIAAGIALVFAGFALWRGRNLSRNNELEDAE